MAHVLKNLASRDIPLRFSFVKSAEEIDQLPPQDCPEVALVGRSNVGKSSLLNFICGQAQMARVSRTPGRTQLINVFEAHQNAFRILDLPGYGFAASPREVQQKWHRTMEDLFTKRPNLCGILFLMDIRRDVELEDANLVHWFMDLGLKVILIQTKCDKIHKSQWAIRRREQTQALKIGAEQAITTSADKKLGMSDVFAAISGLLYHEVP